MYMLPDINYVFHSEFQMVNKRFCIQILFKKKKSFISLTILF